METFGGAGERGDGGRVPGDDQLLRRFLSPPPNIIHISFPANNLYTKLMSENNVPGSLFVGTFDNEQHWRRGKLFKSSKSEVV